jgi:glutamate synthase domain-containing protein 2
MRSKFVIIFTLLTILFLYLGYSFSLNFYWVFIVIAPLFILGLYEMVQVKRAIMRNFPLLGRMRYVMENLRPKIYQYFIESDTDGTPINRIFRSVVYQRAKNQLQTTPFGTQLDVYRPGYEWINHSMNPLGLDQVKHDDMRTTVGGPACKKPYSASLINISAMSFGSLSHNAIMSLNKGAKAGNFAHNTGEGSISPFHKKHGGDLIWQIGTGYFGCRTKDGGFDSDKFQEKANDDQVKMIEIKLSQGAKPGHGGILPAIKNTPEIAAIRGVEPHTTVASPSGHKEFSDANGLLNFIKKLRDLSGAKPVGIKICFGNPSEFDNLCKEMVSTGISPDFITVDGAEGGTGAAPLEFSNSIGTPLREGLVNVYNFLKIYDLKKDIKIFASGKVISGFHVVKALALGADAVYCARAMMLSLGCIQALECNKNNCPAGIATQDPSLSVGLVVENKYKRVYNYHHATIESVTEILAAAGKASPCELNRGDIWKRVNVSDTKSFADVYPYPS